MCSTRICRQKGARQWLTSCGLGKFLSRDQDLRHAQPSETRPIRNIPRQLSKVQVAMGPLPMATAVSGAVSQQRRSEQRSVVQRRNHSHRNVHTANTQRGKKKERSATQRVVALRGKRENWSKLTHPTDSESQSSCLPAAVAVPLG